MRESTSCWTATCAHPPDESRIPNRAIANHSSMPHCCQQCFQSVQLARRSELRGASSIIRRQSSLLLVSPSPRRRSRWPQHGAGPKAAGSFDACRSPRRRKTMRNHPNPPPYHMAGPKRLRRLARDTDRPRGSTKHEGAKGAPAVDRVLLAVMYLNLPYMSTKSYSFQRHAGAVTQGWYAVRLK